MKIEFSEAFVTPNIGEIFSESTRIMMQSLHPVIAENFDQFDKLRSIATNLIEPIRIQHDLMMAIPKPILDISSISEHLTFQNTKAFEQLKLNAFSFSQTVSLGLSDYTFGNILDIENDNSIEVQVEDSETLEELIEEVNEKSELNWRQYFNMIVTFIVARPILSHVLKTLLDHYIVEIFEVIFQWVCRHFLELLTFILSLIGS